MSFGAFMEGLQGGVKSGQSIRREKQLDDIYDSARRKIKNEETSDDIGRESLDLPMGDDTALPDPLGQRIWEWGKGLFAGGDDVATAVPDPGAAALQDKVSDVETLRTGIPQADPSTYPGEGLAPYADGGKPSMDEEERKRELERAKRYGATAEQAIPAVGNVAGKTMAAGPKAAKGAMHGLADIVDTGTDDPIDGGFIGRAVEGAFDYPRVAVASGLRAVGDKVGGMLEPGAPKQAVPAPAAFAAPTAKRSTTGLPPGGRNRTSSAAASGTAIPAPGKVGPPKPEQSVMSPDVIKKIPWDKVDPMTLPKFKTQDWAAYRETAVKQIVMRGGGITVADAMDKVDQQMIAMQQRGTKALLQEGIMRLQSGDLKGAGNALVQMFQYVPSGTDAVVGTYNGQLVAQFVDEETGQPVGEPTPVDAKMLGDLWQQYSNPASWAEMDQSRQQLADTQKRTGLLGRAQDLAEDRYKNVEIPGAQSEADYRAMLGEGALARAIGGGGGGGGGADGLKPSEQLAIDEDVRKTVEKAVMWTDEDGEPLHPRLQDPNIQTALLAAIMKMKRQTGKPSEEILLEILSAAKE